MVMSVWYIINLSISEKTELGSFVSVSKFVLMAEQGALKWLEILSDTFSNNI